MKSSSTHIDNSYLRYANCWEDADILIEALQLEEGDSILSIGSGGDNSFSLLINNPTRVVAADINPHQLKLISLKKAAFKGLDYPEFVAFLGFKESNKRQELFKKVIPFLKKDDSQYWKNKHQEIESGIIHQGKFEKYFQTFSSKILPKIHSNKKIKELFRPKSEKEQQDFFNKRWNTWKWRLLFRIFFSRYVMGKFGRDPKFLKQVAVPVSTYILNKAKEHLSSVQCQSNCFLKYILTNQFGSLLPHYAREEHFEQIKINIDKLTIFEGYAEDAFTHFQSFNKFNLSNIFEYMSTENFEKSGNYLAKMSEPESRFVYWNLMVDRKLSNIVSGLKLEQQFINEANKLDKGFFYNSLIIENK